MRTDPATSKQREFAAALGVEIPLDATVGEAMELIRSAPATATQHRQAAEIDLHIPEGATFNEAQRLLAVAYSRAGKRTIGQMGIKVGDVLLKEGKLWRVQKIFNGYKISLKAVRPIKRNGRVELVPTSERGKVFNAFTFRTATKVDPQTLVL